MQNRLPFFDFLKGLAIIMVVGIHTFPHVDGYNSFEDSMIILVRLLLNCAVPLFLGISGWMLANKPLISKHEIIEFYKRRITRVYLPLVICGLGWFALALWHKPSYSEVVRNLIYLFTGSFAVYYFVILIIQCYLLTPLLTRHYNGGLIVCAILSAIAIIVTSWLINVEGHSFPLILYSGPVYLWIVFFMLGIWLRKHETKSYFTSGLILQYFGYF